jgi:hypothetical protein
VIFEEKSTFQLMAIAKGAASLSELAYQAIIFAVIEFKISGDV